MGDVILACHGAKTTTPGHQFPHLGRHANLQAIAAHVVDVADVLDVHIVLILPVLIWHALIFVELLLEVMGHQVHRVQALIHEDLLQPP